MVGALAEVMRGFESGGMDDLWLGESKEGTVLSMWRVFIFIGEGGEKGEMCGRMGSDERDEQG